MADAAGDLMLPIVPPYRVFLGFDASELEVCRVAEESIVTCTSRREVRIERIGMDRLIGYYRRPSHRMPNGQLFDEISDAPMSTGHAIARFFVPFLCGYLGWALFTDGDVLVREDVRQLFALADARYAVQVVQHPPLLEEGAKKGGHVQQTYPRKNWSSVMLFNCAHPSNQALTLDVLNAWPGRDLHAFRWLQDEEIGALPARWNYLVGVNPAQSDPALVHFTLGAPSLPERRQDPFADEWRAMARRAGYHEFDEVPLGRG